MTQMRDYSASRSRKEPRFQGEVAAAEAELSLGEAIAMRRGKRNLSLEEVTEITDIPVERIEALESGDGATVNEMLWLLHALDLSIFVGPAFSVTVHGPTLLRRSAG
ncbi:MAG: helix-turn-helix domain-containing protein [Thermomicrobiales bacterium]|nr:helix-turn-helix domain-containing protein [Thermomicrobiales bacterium]